MNTKLLGIVHRLAPDATLEPAIARRAGRGRAGTGIVRPSERLPRVQRRTTGAARHRRSPVTRPTAPSGPARSRATGAGA